jgi:phosphate transport system protein
MQRHSEIEMEKLRNRVIKMGSLVEDQTRDSFKALISGDLNLAYQIIEKEHMVDQIDVKIDKLCQRIIALTQPVASDLRVIIAALKMDSDLERIGDFAVDIAEKIESIKSHMYFISTLKIDEFAQVAEKMIKDSIDCFVNKDLLLAKAILRLNKLQIEKAQQIYQNIIDKMILDKEIIIVLTNLLTILRCIERIIEHTTNIAEDVIFMIEGNIVKHSNISEPPETH